MLLHVHKTASWRMSVAVMLALGVAACSGDSGWFSKSELSLTRPEWNLLAKENVKTRVIRADDLIGADGRCAGDAPAAAPGAFSSSQVLNFTAGPQVPGSEAVAPPIADPTSPPAAPARRGVALGMAECDVIRAIGYTDRMEISANELGQRSVVLTYPRGERPGIYRFVGGQLVAIERAGEPPPAAKPPTKAKKTAKPTPS